MNLQQQISFFQAANSLEERAVPACKLSPHLLVRDDDQVLGIDGHLWLSAHSVQACQPIERMSKHIHTCSPLMAERCTPCEWQHTAMHDIGHKTPHLLPRDGRAARSSRQQTATHNMCCMYNRALNSSTMISPARP